MLQLLRYMHDPDYQPQWLLRHGDKLFYLYAAMYIVYYLLDYIPYVSERWHEAQGRWWLMALEWAIMLLYFSAIGLVMGGLGQLLKRLMPVIDDARTLV